MTPEILLEFAVDCREAAFIASQGAPIGWDRVFVDCHKPTQHQPGSFTMLSPLCPADAEVLLGAIRQQDPHAHELRYLAARIQAKLDIVNEERVDLMEKAAERAAKKAQKAAQQPPSPTPTEPANGLF